jgi:hypothetical protein
MMTEAEIIEFKKKLRRQSTWHWRLKQSLIRQIKGTFVRRTFLEAVEELNALAKKEKPKKLTFKEIVRLKNMGRK